MCNEISLLEFHCQRVWSQNLNVSPGRSLHFRGREHGNEPDASGHEVETWINRAQHMGLKWYLREDRQRSLSRKQNQGAKGGEVRKHGGGAAGKVTPLPPSTASFLGYRFFSLGYSQLFCFCFHVLFLLSFGMRVSSLLSVLGWWGVRWGWLKLTFGDFGFSDL